MSRRKKPLVTPPPIEDEAVNPISHGPAPLDAEDFELAERLRRLESRAGSTSERKEFAQALDRFGCKLGEFFKAGSDAGSEQRDELVALVQTLATHLSTSIVNLHNVAVELAQARASAGDPDNKARSLGNAQMMGMLAAMAGAQQPTEEKPNGKAKGK